jgi:glycosyltransferase involved in cell wall biosynthesis
MTHVARLAVACLVAIVTTWVPRGPFFGTARVSPAEWFEKRSLSVGDDLRIAVVHNLLRGGAHRRLREQVSHLHGDVREFTLTTAAAVTDTPVVVDARQRADGTSRLIRPIPRYLDVERLVTAWSNLFEQIERWQADVVFLNPCHLLQSPTIPNGWNGAVLYFCDEPRRVDYEPAARLSTNPRTRTLYAGLRRRQRQLDRRSVARADVILTNSAWTARRIRDSYGREARPLHLGVGPQFHAGTHGPARHALSVGTLIPSKGHELAIRAVAASGIKLPVVVVAPRTGTDEAGRLQAVADDVGIRLDIRVGISDEELAHLYGHALATLYLARDEPLGLASLESQACGTPVIVADEGGLPETIEDGLTGWAVSRESTDAGLRLLELAEGGLREGMFHATAAHGRNFTWAASTEQLELALRRLAGEQASVPA